MDTSMAIKILDCVATSMLDDMERGDAKAKQAHEVMGMAMDALAENAELKARLEKAVELVDLAVSDLNGVYGSESCDFCENFSFCDDHDQSYCDGINFKWQHQAKLEEMKGGAK